MLKGGTVRFVFPEGHPHYGKTVEVIPGVVFRNGVYETGREEAMRLEATLYFHHSAALEGSEELDTLQEQYDANPAVHEALEKQKAEEARQAELKAKAAEIRAGRRAKRAAEAAAEPSAE